MSDAPAPTRAEGAREDGQTAYEARFAEARPREVVPWADQPDDVKAVWARVEIASAARAEAEVARLSDLIAGYEEAMADKRRLARMIDVAMHGEEGAALHPSLCDLVGPASDLRKAVARLTAENERMRERCAQTAEADRGVDDCPYSNDKPGDPTWHHTDDDVCPRCRKIGKDSGSACVGVAKHRIAAAIRALPASGEGGGDG